MPSRSNRRKLAAILPVQRAIAVAGDRYDVCVDRLPDSWTRRFRSRQTGIGARMQRLDDVDVMPIVARRVEEHALYTTREDPRPGRFHGATHLV